MEVLTQELTNLSEVRGNLDVQVQHYAALQEQYEALRQKHDALNKEAGELRKLQPRLEDLQMEHRACALLNATLQVSLCSWTAAASHFCCTEGCCCECVF